MTPSEAARRDFYAALLEDDAVELYERAPIAYVSTDPAGRLVKVNERFVALTGLRREDVVGRLRFVDLLSAGGRLYHETHFAPLLRLHGAAREIAFDLVSAGGGRVPVLVTAVLERHPDGEPRVVRMALFDAGDRRRYEQELLAQKRRAEESEARVRELAATLQQSLLPATPPAVPGLDLVAAFRPADVETVIGGDFYDVFQTGPQDWVVSIGDVCGKGAEAAVVTGLVRYTIRAAAVRDPSPRSVLTEANQAVSAHESQRFCTAAVVHLHRADGGWRAVVATAGHPPAICLQGSRVRQVGDPAPPLGVVGGRAFRPANRSLPLGPGRTLVLYTDGVTEARRDGAFYGEDRLLERLVRLDPAPSVLVPAVVDDVVAFQRDRCRDDIAVVALRAAPGSAT